VQAAAHGFRRVVFLVSRYSRHATTPGKLITNILLTRDGRVTPDPAGRAESGRELVLADDDVRRPRGQFRVVVQIVQRRRARVVVSGAERYAYLVCNGHVKKK